MSDTNLKIFEPVQVMANFQAFQTMATVFAEWGALPNGIKNAPQLIMIMQAWIDLWLSVTEAMQSLSIINWRVTMYGEVVTKRVLEKWYDVEFVKEELEDLVFEKDWQKYKRLQWFCTVKLSKWEKSFTETFTIEEARNANLLTKDNRKNYPKIMLRYRAVRNAVKFFCPEVLWWIPMYEEMKDYFWEDEKKSSTKNRSFDLVSDEDILDWFDTNWPEIVVDVVDVVEIDYVPVVIENNIKEVLEEVLEDVNELSSKKVPKKEEVVEEEVVEEVKIKDRVKWWRVVHKLLKWWIIDDTFWEQVLVKFDSWALKQVSRATLTLE